MRIVAIGLGGAGSRIVDRLYATDRRSSKVACVQALAVDVDEESLKSLGNLPDSAKLFFPPLDPQIGNTGRPESPTATIDISEIISRFQNYESGETDAIVLCLGLGGSLTEVAPHIIAGLRSATAEAIFGLVTLPCLAEGEKRSAKAADGIDMLAPHLDGMILFDNETWYKKTAALKEKILNREKGLAEKLGFGKQEPDLSPRMVTYRLLNDSIVRRISLILRAGEFRADGGIDLAEVVLDSGEVLNTMKGMGFITIGYAVEQTVNNPLGFLSHFRPKGIFDDENKKKAARIVELAKQAIYNEISTPCDMTSAHKALILVAGPSHELSMKGFMTVRKWIDRSIAGLETRSGDYPVVNTKNVAIIIMLSGLENIPRVGELREIREHFRHPARRTGTGDLVGAGTATHPIRTPGEISDEMIVLPQKMQKNRPEEPFAMDRKVPPNYREETGSLQRREQVLETGESHRTSPAAGATIPIQETIRGTEIPARGMPPQQHRRPAIVEQEDTPPSRPRVAADLPKPVSRAAEQPPERPEGHIPTETRSYQNTSPARDLHSPQIETPRQKIERELERQRIISAPERIQKSDSERGSPQLTPATSVKSRQSSPFTLPSGKTRTPSAGQGIPQEAEKVPEKRTVVITRKKTGSPNLPQVPQSSPVPKQEKYIPTDEPVSKEVKSENIGQDSTPEGDAIDLKDSSVRAKDRVFEGKMVLKGSVPQPRDSALLKSNLHLGKKTHKMTGDEPDTEREEQTRVDPESGKQKDKSIKKKDEISWI